MSMEIKEVVKKAIQNEFRCGQCNFKEKCEFFRGDKKAKQFGCNADRYKKGYLAGLNTPIEEVKEMIIETPSLLQAFLSSLSRIFADNCERAYSSLMAVRETYKINSREIETTFIITTEENDGDNINIRAQRFATAIVEHHFTDVPEEIKKQLIFLFACSIITGYDMKEVQSED